MVTATALKQKCSLPEAQSHLAGKRPAGRLSACSSTSSKVRGTTEEGEELEGRLTESLRETLGGTPAWSARWRNWKRRCGRHPRTNTASGVRRRYVATLAQAVRAAAVARQEEISEDDLNVGRDLGPDNGSAENLPHRAELGRPGPNRKPLSTNSCRGRSSSNDGDPPRPLPTVPDLTSNPGAAWPCSKRAVTDPADLPLPGCLPAGASGPRVSGGGAGPSRRSAAPWSKRAFLSSRAAVVSVVTRAAGGPGSSPADRRPDGSGQTGNWRRDRNKASGWGIDPRVFAYLLRPADAAQEPAPARL